jgi:hypothetical protein
VLEWSLPMMRSRSLWVLYAVVSSSCAKPTAPPAAAVSHAQLPLTVTWEQLELSTTKLRMRAHIKRIAPIAAPLSIQIEVPSMARMTVGRTMFDVPANVAADELVEPVELTYTQLPVQDVVLRVTASNAGGGFKAAVPYRFGRIAPVEAP